MRHVARFLAACLAASLLSVTAPALATPSTTSSPGVTTSTAQDANTPTAAEKRKKKRLAKKKRVAKKKRLAKKRAAAARKKIVRVAARHKGAPYRWGGTTPSGFDCSGYVKYVMKKAVKKNLPRIAGDQMKKGRSVSKSKKRKGDLIGFHSGSGYYHIGIYAGRNKIWHAPRPGRSVEKVKIWTSAYKVRRLTR